MYFVNGLNRFWLGCLRSGLVGIVGLGVGCFGAFAPAVADVTLTRADVESLLNRVELIPRGRSARPARLSDFLALGDALRTAASSRAELRFNDGSLARLGERATFRFVPNTRNFRLSNGTVLMLIPPGRGRTTIQTPNTVTGIQGSALLVRYSEDSDMTVVMVLTENPDGPVTLTSGGQEHGLLAGEMALVRGDFVEIFEFDLQHFYDTSSLVQGLHLDDSGYQSGADDPTDAVRAETTTALEAQEDFVAEATINPEVISLDGNQSVSQTSLFLEGLPGTGTGAVTAGQYSTVTSSGLVTSGTGRSSSFVPSNSSSSTRPSSSLPRTSSPQVEPTPPTSPPQVEPTPPTFPPKPLGQDPVGPAPGLNIDPNQGSPEAPGGPASPSNGDLPPSL
ncbi:hypothetical protein C7271_04915 [filamentous cyanobacterium CCP5]|nr:hypothetical protein C7271_04915 [filamentous cyanobacterium CCP5]